PNGELAATVGSDLALRVWDAKSGRELWWKAVAETQPPPQAVAFSADSRHVIATQGESAWRWEATSGKDAGRYVGHGATVVRARFSTDGRVVATASWDRTARLWDAASGREIKRFSGEAYGISLALLSPDEAERHLVLLGDPWNTP